MALVGIVITLAGFAVAVASLGMMSSTSGRLLMVVAGIIISLVGIMGVINPAYEKHAVWKK